MTIAGIDLGSVRLAVVLGVEELPLRLASPARTLKVDPKDLDVVVGVVVEMLIQAGVTRAAIEHGAPYVPKGADEAAAAAMWRAHTVCTRLEERLYPPLRAAGIEVVTMARRTWSSRVVPHHRGGISEAESNDGVRGFCGEGVYESFVDQDGRRDQDQIDAAGVLLGAWLIDQAPRRRHHKYRDRRIDKTKPRPIELTPEQRKAKRQEQKNNWRRQQMGTRPIPELVAAGCLCFVDRERRRGRHKAGCPLAPPARLRGLPHP